MKPVLKISFLLFLMVSLFNFSCTKEKAFMNDGIITGFDNRMCPCCGGLMISFIGETQPYKGEFYLITNNPSELGIDNSSVFPIHIKVDWTQQGCTTGGTGNLIKITRFKKL